MGEIKFDLGYNDCVYLVQREFETVISILRALGKLYLDGLNSYSSTRLIKMAFELRGTYTYVTENRIRRVLWMMIAIKPRLIHIKQKGRYR